MKGRCSWALCLTLIGVAAAMAVETAADGKRPERGNLYRFTTGLRLGEAAVFPPWWNTLQRNNVQSLEFDRCLAEVNTCRRRWRSLRALVLQARGLNTEDKLELVNRFMNRRKYKPDRRHNNPAPGAETEVINRKVRSHWSTLFEFMERGGDCEDFAAAKYFLLRSLGLAAERLRVVVVWERRARGFHAILAYRWPNDDVWLLESDNRIKKRSHSGYRYVYALNEQAVWDYRQRPEWNHLGDSR